MESREGKLQEMSLVALIPVHKNRIGTKSIVIAERKCSSSLVLFFLVVVAILSSVKKPLKMEPKRLSQFPLPGGEEFVSGQKASK